MIGHVDMDAYLWVGFDGETSYKVVPLQLWFLNYNHH